MSEGIDDREAAFVARAERAEELVNIHTNGKDLSDIEEVRRIIYNMAILVADKEAEARAR